MYVFYKIANQKNTSAVSLTDGVVDTINSMNKLRKACVIHRARFFYISSFLMINHRRRRQVWDGCPAAGKSLR